MDGIARDLRMGMRLLARDKAFTLTAAATLALCIGANTALFSVVHHVLLRPLPVPAPEQLVLMSNVYPQAGAGDSTNSGVPDYYDRLAATDVFTEQAMYNTSNPSVDQDGVPTQLWVMNVTPSYFRVMGVAPARGRIFTDDEGLVGQQKKVVLSDALWRRQFGSDPSAVGREMRLNGEPYTIVGVMPRSFAELRPGIQLWRPIAFTPEQKADDQRHSNNYWNVARLKPGARIERAQAEIDALNAANLERFPAFREILTNAGFRTAVEPFAARLTRDVKPTLFLLWGGASFVLLIGFVNVANLVLVRTRVRLKELATRLAVGAGPAQLARQLVVENLILTLAAGGLGLLIAAFAVQAAGSFALDGLPHGSEIAIDAVAVAYAVGVSLVAGLLMGLLPALSSLPRNLASVLHEEGRSTTGGRGARTLRQSLIVAQTAFTFVLLVGAGLLLASLDKLLRVEPGFDADHVLTASVALPAARYTDDPAQRRFAEEVLRQVREAPGVMRAGVTDTIPLGNSSSDSVIVAEGYQMKPGESVISPRQLRVSPGYFETMGIKMVKGRAFEEKDTAGSLPVLIVDEKLAQRFWPGQDPIGRRMYSPQNPEDLLAITDKTVFLTVVGVVPSVKLSDLAEGEKTVGAYYFAMAQNPSGFMTFALKTSADPESLGSALRSAVASVDRDLPVFDVQTMDQRKEKALLGRRSPALLSVAFGVVALLLSAVGLYGVLAYLVTQRTKEFGIRIALGSSAAEIFKLVIREGLGLLAAGLAIGALGAFTLRHSLESQLFGVRSGDPRVLVGVTVLLAMVAVLACALPARRATRIDPRTALAE